MNIFQRYFLKLKHNRINAKPMKMGEFKVSIIADDGNEYTVFRSLDARETISVYKEQKMRYPTILRECKNITLLQFNDKEIETPCEYLLKDYEIKELESIVNMIFSKETRPVQKEMKKQKVG